MSHPTTHTRISATKRPLLVKKQLIKISLWSYKYLLSNTIIKKKQYLFYFVLTLLIWLFQTTFVFDRKEQKYYSVVLHGCIYIKRIFLWRKNVFNKLEILQQAIFISSHSLVVFLSINRWISAESSYRS